MPLTRFTLRQLEAFTAVADARGFSAAARRLGLTAQAVSQQVAELESLLGFRLFERSTRSVVLSSAGRQYLPSAQTVLRHARAAETAAADLRHQAAGLVSVGAPLVLASHALPAAIRAHAAAAPGLVVRLRDLSVDALVDAVAAGDVDLAVGPDRATGAAVSATPLFDSPWVLWCAPGHPLARLRQVRWRTLREHVLVAAGRDHERSVGPMGPAAPAHERITPGEVVDNISTALGIAAQGLAVTLAPAYVAVLAQPLGLQMRRVVGPETLRQVCLYRPTQRPASPAAEAFAAFLATWLPGWGLTAGADPPPTRRAGQPAQ